ncbi:hypothetical protein KL938_003369 [Ogataea parapolymorpha]|nr:hypothetical protein KL938_003369 [Ogataea parapolymorpha]
MKNLRDEKKGFTKSVLQDPDALERRRNRFLKDQDHIRLSKNAEFGLISRGEDLRLQQNECARRDLLTKIQSNIKTNAKPDSILMDFRKLRESLLSQPHTEFAKDVFVNSIHYSASIGHHQSYVPSILHLMEAEKKNQLMSSTEKEPVLLILALHKAHYNGEFESVFELLLLNFDIAPNFGKPASCAPEAAFFATYALMTKDFYLWTRQYNYLSKNPCYKSVMDLRLKAFRQTEVETLHRSYFMLNKRVLLNFVNTSWEELCKDHNIGWTLENDTVTIRRRK